MLPMQYPLRASEKVGFLVVSRKMGATLRNVPMIFQFSLKKDGVVHSIIIVICYMAYNLLFTFLLF